jgi:hypothetical protein
VICDSAGISAKSTPQEKGDLVDAASKSDLIIWVSKATQPARALDLEVLKEIRRNFEANPKLRQPPTLLVLSHIDQLSPATEWSPPYDLADEGRKKANSIRDALNFVSKTLEFSDLGTPMCLRSGVVYNLDALWSAIEKHADDARMVALDRAMKESSFSARRIVGQIARGTRSVIRTAVEASHTK